MQIPLSRPDITEREIERVVDVLRSPTLSLGPVLREFETAFAAYIGRRRAVAVNSGTSGLFLSLLAMGIGEGDEVITTPFTFIASATTIMMTGARPVFVDIDPVSLNIDPQRIEAAITGRTKAILPVEAFGNPAGFDNDLPGRRTASHAGRGGQLRGIGLGAGGQESRDVRRRQRVRLLSQ